MLHVFSYLYLAVSSIRELHWKKYGIWICDKAKDFYYFKFFIFMFIAEH